MTAFPWEDDLPNTPSAEEIHAADPDPVDPIVEEVRRVPTGDPLTDGRETSVEELLDAGVLRETPGVALEVSSAAIDLRAIDSLLDTLADPGELAKARGNVEDTVVDAVRRRADRRSADRREKLGDKDPTSSTDVRLEAVGAANDHDVLSTLAAAFKSGADEAKAIAGDLLDELPGRGGKARASLKVADGTGFELTVTRSKSTGLSVDVDEVVEILVAHALADAAGTETLDLKTHPSKVYASGIRDGIALFRSVLASPSFKSTALDSLVLTLEGADDDDLAKRLRKAYGRVEKGNPSVKLDRKPVETKGEDS